MSRKEINGRKFGRALLEKCRMEKIPSSAYVVLLISLYECDQEQGTLNKPHLPTWADQNLGICYETLNYGWNQLLEKGIIAERFDGSPRFEIVNYHQLTFKSEENKGYFRVPTTLLTSDFFQQLIKLKDWKSAWFTFYLLSRISAQPKGYGSVLKIRMATLKGNTILNRRDSYRIRKILSALTLVFDIAFPDMQRRGNQIHIKEIHIRLNKRYLVEDIDAENRKIFGKLASNVKKILVKKCGISLSKTEIRDICFSFVQEVRRGPKSAIEILYHSLLLFSDVYSKRVGTKDEINNKAGYIRKLFREANFNYSLKLEPFNRPVQLPYSLSI